MDIKQISVKEAHVLPHATYFVTHFDNLVGVFSPVVQDNGKNMRWIVHDDRGIMHGCYYTARELDDYLRKFSPTENKIYQAYLELGDVRFKVANKSSIELMLKEHDTLNAHKTTAVRKPAVRKTVRKPVTRKVKRA